MPPAGPVAYPLPGSLVAGTFLERTSRFSAWVETGEGRRYVHVPNSGRLGELLVPGAAVYFRPHRGAERTTVGDLVLTRTDRDVLVSIDARIPPGLMEGWLTAGVMAEFAGWLPAAREPRYGAGRFDLRLQLAGVAEGPGSTCLVETKSVTLVTDGRARFPDAPTVRGSRHLEELSQAARAGLRAAVVFVIQRGDVARFRPNDETDPEFGRRLRQAVKAGVGVYAWRCQVTIGGIFPGGPVPIEL